MNNRSFSGRRDFIKKTTLLTIGGLTIPNILKSNETDVEQEIEFISKNRLFTLPPLLYATDALEPFIDKMTMEIHHDKHHGAYVTNLNKAVQENNLQNLSLEELCKNVSKYPVAVRNNGGGHWNHSFFWKIMKPDGGGNPSGALAIAIKNTFGSFEDFKNSFNDVASKRFGSGWAWLIVNKEGKLEIGSTPNQDNPLMDISELRGSPVIGLDVWEHAYYLKYQNKRAEYISSWWNIINWEEAEKNYSLVK